VEIKSEVEAKVAEVKSAAQGEDVAGIKSATEALGQVVQKIGAAVYQQPNTPGDGAAATDTGTNPNPEAGPDVVEGEVKE
jgi:molecular chaperone DnaK